MTPMSGPVEKMNWASMSAVRPTRLLTSSYRRGRTRPHAIRPWAVPLRVAKSRSSADQMGTRQMYSQKAATQIQATPRAVASPRKDRRRPSIPLIFTV